MSWQMCRLGESVHHFRLTTVVVAAAWGTLAVAQGPLSVLQHSGGFSQPLAYIQDPLDPNTKFAVQKNGIIQKVTGGFATNTLINISASVSFTPSDEQGLLGMAFAPNHSSTGHFYLYFTDTAGNIQVSRYTRTGDTAALATRLDIINIAHPTNSNHNGATPMFGPDGFLYLGIGDGGGANDPNNNAQNPNLLLGKMLRIDPSADAFPGDPTKNYTNPSSNPFFGSNGVVQAADEIWAFGVRNPYKYSFDRATGAMVMGDVGQNAFEEINYVPAGAAGRNYGWRQREGAHDSGLGGSSAFLPLTDPILDYGRNNDDPIIGGRTITGGVVYRGTRLAGYQGRYFFADFISRRIWSLGLNVDSITGEATAGNLIEHTTQFGGRDFLGNMSSINEGMDGELFITSFNGNVYQVVPEPGSLVALGLGALVLLRRRRKKL